MTKDNERIADWDETANYKGSDYIGKVGIELSYEQELHGTTGVRGRRSRFRQPRHSHTEAPAPVAGDNLTLSLDIELQRPPRRRSAIAAARSSRSTRTRATCSRSYRSGFGRTCSSTGIDAANWGAGTNRPTSRC
jgi:penicillin-binding protein 2